jgi:hypothetical protein
MLNQDLSEGRRLIRSRGFGRTLMIPLWVVLVLMLGSCATVDADRIQYAGASHLPPSDPSTVQILREAPTQPNERLGEIVVDASMEPSTPVSEVEEKLRLEGSKLGADAVIVVYDSIEPVAFINPWWGGTLRAIDGRKLIGVAIKYHGEAAQRPG